MQLGAVYGWYPQPHGLPKDMAQRQRMQNPQRMDQRFVSQVGLRRLLDWANAGQHVSMRQHNSFGVASSAGGKQDLQRCFRRDARHRPQLFGRQLRQPVFKLELRPRRSQLAEQHRIAHHQFGRHIGSHACGKLRRAESIQRHSQHPAQHAPVKSRNPFRAVFGPQKHAIAHADAAALEQRGKAPRQPRNLPVRGDPAPVPLIPHHSDRAIVAPEVVEECSQMISHGRSRQAPGPHFQRFRCATRRRSHCENTMASIAWRDWAGCDTFWKCLSSRSASTMIANQPECECSARGSAITVRVMAFASSSPASALF